MVAAGPDSRELTDWARNELWKAERTPEVWSRDDRDVLAAFQIEEMVIVRHYEVGFAVNGAFEDTVVVRIGRDQIECRLRDDDLCDLRNEADTLLKVGFWPCEVRPKDLGDFPDDWHGNE